MLDDVLVSACFKHCLLIENCKTALFGLFVKQVTRHRIGCVFRNEAVTIAIDDHCPLRKKSLQIRREIGRWYEQPIVDAGQLRPDLLTQCDTVAHVVRHSRVDRKNPAAMGGGRRPQPLDHFRVVAKSTRRDNHRLGTQFDALGTHATNATLLKNQIRNTRA
ncbi:hypothetical protein D3C84_805280 [compost metagenome]